mgnify:CR=1 FL=1
MGRKSNIRQTYETDTTTLRRILQGVRRDPARSKHWKIEVAAALSRAIILMMEDTAKLMAKEAKVYDEKAVGLAEPEPAPVTALERWGGAKR